MTAKLTADSLTLFRGERCLFENLSFALNPGELLLLEGCNGSGKTSLIRAIAGLIELESGEIYWDEQPVRRQRQVFNNELVWMAHRVGFKADLSLVENLRFESALRRDSRHDLDDILTRLNINRLKRLPVRSLSAGQQRRVALARMLMSAATLWMMDEPVTNLDREGRSLVMTLVSEHLARGGMVIMAAHQDIQIDFPVHTIQLQ
ncbi:MAG: cytochrome c biogenesis heme-transporting ATPase CcmA [Gammaproteobacteria bacterium]